MEELERLEKIELHKLIVEAELALLNRANNPSSPFECAWETLYNSTCNILAQFAYIGESA